MKLHTVRTLHKTDFAVSTQAATFQSVAAREKPLAYATKRRWETWMCSGWMTRLESFETKLFIPLCQRVICCGVQATRCQILYELKNVCFCENTCVFKGYGWRNRITLISKLWAPPVFEHFTLWEQCMTICSNSWLRTVRQLWLHNLLSLYKMINGIIDSSQPLEHVNFHGPHYQSH